MKSSVCMMLLRLEHSHMPESRSDSDMQVMKNWEKSCQSRVIGMTSYPHHYPRYALLYHPEPSPPPLFLFPFSPLSFCLLFFVLYFSFLSSPCPFSSFFVYFICAFLCFVCISAYVCPCVFGQSFPVRQ